MSRIKKIICIMGFFFCLGSVAYAKGGLVGFCNKLTGLRSFYNMTQEECLTRYTGVDEESLDEMADRLSDLFERQVKNDNYEAFVKEYTSLLDKQPKKTMTDCKPGVEVESCTQYFSSSYDLNDFIDDLAVIEYKKDETTGIETPVYTYDLPQKTVENLYDDLKCPNTDRINQKALQKCAEKLSEKNCTKTWGFNSCFGREQDLIDTLEDTLTQNEDLVYREQFLSINEEMFNTLRDMTVDTVSNEDIMAIDKKALEGLGYSEDLDTPEARRKLLKKMEYEEFSKIMVNSSASALNDMLTDYNALGMAGASLPSDSFYIKSGYFDLLDKYKFSAGCFACPLFEIFFDTINDISMGIDRVLTPFLKILLAIGLAFWMLWQILKNVAIFSKKGFASFGQFVTLFSRGLFRGLVAAALLSVGLKVAFHYTLEPVVEFSTIYATEVMNVSKNRIKLSQAIDPSLSKSLESVEPCSIGRKPKETKGPFSRDIYNSFNCFLRTTSWSLAQGFAFGQYVLELVFSSQENGGFWIWKAFYSLRYLDVMLSGFFILISFFALMVLIPFKLMNILIDFAVVTALFPIFVVAWVFPFTQKAMTKKAFDLFIGACFQLIVISVLLVLGVDFMVTMLGVDVNEFMEDVFKNDKETLEILRTKISVLYTSAPYLLLGAMFIVVKMLGLSNTLSSSIVSGSSTDMGGTMLGKTFKSIVLPYAAAKSIRDDFHKKQKEEEAKKKKGSTP
ncbi:MAG: hypothetical protein PHI50_01620 [Alphaproteobacteria bacterium]|nr:hypothetical protein [Alphaproteobacteria bacterium]